MDFLDARGALVRHAQVHVGGAEHRADLPAALAGERQDVHLALVGGRDRGDDVRGNCRDVESASSASPLAPSARTCFA